MEETKYVRAKTYNTEKTKEVRETKKTNRRHHISQCDNSNITKLSGFLLLTGLTGICQLFHTKSHDFKSFSYVNSFSTWTPWTEIMQLQSDVPREERDVGYIHIPRQIKSGCNKYIGLKWWLAVWFFTLDQLLHDRKLLGDESLSTRIRSTIGSKTRMMSNRIHDELNNTVLHLRCS